MDPILAYLDGLTLGIFSWFVGAALFSVAMFKWADDTLHPDIRARARTWFLPTPAAPSIDFAGMFRALFEAVFGSRHLSASCVARSVIASLVFFTVLMAAGFAQVAAVHGPAVWSDYWRQILPSTLALVVLVNCVTDYLSLWETRWVLRAMDGTRSAAATVLWVLLDAGVTALIYVVVFYLAAAAYFILLEPGGPPGIGAIAGELWKALAAVGNLVSGHTEADRPSELLLAHVTIGASVVTTFTTSIWLWLALLGGPLARAIVWGRGGLTAAGRVLDTEARPFTALGNVVALLLLSLGAVAWGVSSVVSFGA